MALEMSQFHEAFFEEAFESLDAMEAALLALDPQTPNSDVINTVFRGAHSLKGGSGMFGFTDITGLTHTLETLLDELRAGRRAVSARLVDLLLKATDVLRGLLQATQRKTPTDQQALADIQFDLEQVIAQKAADVPPAAPAAAPVPRQEAGAAPQTATEEAAAAPAGERWHIAIRPNAELLRLGNDPMRMFAELAALGDLHRRVDASRLPALGSVDPEVCYLSWDLELLTAVAREVIAGAFEWADGDCDLVIERATPPALPPELLRPPVAARAEAVAKAAPVAASDSNSIRVSIEKLDELMNTVGELVITQSLLMGCAQGDDAASRDRLKLELSHLDRTVRELQETVMRVRMLPISVAFSRFPRMVRDLAQKLGKQIELKMSGEQTEVDKTVLEKIGDPLIHLVRNSVDHGIEATSVRLAAGKSAHGTVSLDACHSGGTITIVVSDDGGGLDKARIHAKALERGLITDANVLSDEEIYDLIFMPGFSTAEKTTDLSGRGVGMDVVRRNIQSLGGKVTIGSEPGRGSRFLITLPLTLAIVEGQSVRVGKEIYILPLVAIVESLQIKPGQVNSLPHGGEVLLFRGAYLPVIRLHELFRVDEQARPLSQGLIIVAESSGQRVGLLVDELLAQQQVVIKSLETNYGHVEGISAATILSDGSIALILDLDGLTRSANIRAVA